MEPSDRDRLDYDQTIRYFLSLHDIRFKLLGFLPVLSGAAVAVVPQHVGHAQQIALACFGALITLGLTSYDQRNTQIYDRLVCRAKFLERQIGFLPLPGDGFGGPFHARPPLQTVFRVKLIWHIQGLTVVYAMCLTAWSFLGLSAIVQSHRLMAALTSAVFVASYGILRCVSNLHHRDTRMIDAAIGSTPRLPNKSLDGM